MDIWRHLEQQIRQATGQDFHIHNSQNVGGGCINSASRVSDGDLSYFIKTNHARHAAMFEAEAEALREMAASHTVRVPQPVCYGEHGNQCYVVMEHLDLGGRADMSSFGRQFAAMHRVTADQFGWHIDNTIGSTPQPNTPSDDWVEFWRAQRLGFQLRTAADNGYGGELQRLGERLLADMPALFSNHRPVPSMLHGDLWGGNYGALRDGTPVIFDPALYYGDREADLAMTELFGGFGQAFYAAYNEAWPLDAGYDVRKIFYNIYHIINHLNLFGGGYHGQAISMIERVLAEL
ncbi:MAG: fructosamine kinase family protein [Thiotrichales bacterium]|nr:MAG: fructosamine kinase family protein [Thiotrichales bacterium]